MDGTPPWDDLPTLSSTRLAAPERIAERTARSRVGSAEIYTPASASRPWPESNPWPEFERLGLVGSTSAIPGLVGSPDEALHAFLERSVLLPVEGATAAVAALTSPPGVTSGEKVRTDEATVVIGTVTVPRSGSRNR